MSLREVVLHPWVLRGVGYPAVAYLAIVIYFTIFQRSMIYVPTKASSLSPSQAGLDAGRTKALSIRTHDGLTLNGWLILAGDAAAAESTTSAADLESGRPVFIYFSGNGGNRARRMHDFAALTRLGADVVAFDYRGYGENPGSPRESDFALDAHSIWTLVTQDLNVDRQRIVLFGESLGGGVATRLASELCEAGTAPAGLVLESPFTSLVDAAAYHFPWLPVSICLVDRYPSIRKIGKVTCPLLIIHGTADAVVPYALGRRLFAAAPSVSASGVARQFVSLKGGDHNDLMFSHAETIGQELRRFLEAPGSGPSAAGH